MEDNNQLLIEKHQNASIDKRSSYQYLSLAKNMISVEEEIHSVTTNEIGIDHFPKNTVTTNKNIINPSETISSSKDEYRLYRYRWLQLLMLSLAALLN